MRTFLIAVLLAVIALLPAPSTLADELPTAPVRPADTTVLLIPTLDETGDVPEMVRSHVVTADHRLAYEFLIHGFRVLSPTLARHAAQDADLDLEDAESRDKKSLRAIGQATNADWIVSVAIVELKSEMYHQFFKNGRRGRAKIQIRVLDVKANEYLTNKFQEESKTNAPTAGLTGLFRQTIDTTVQRCIENLLSAYPIARVIPGEFNETENVPGLITSSEPISANAPTVVTTGIFLAEGTPVPVVIASSIRSDTIRAGDPLMFKVASPVFSSDSTRTPVIAKGAEAFGRVVVAKKREAVGGAGDLQFTCDYANDVYGRRIYLRSDRLGGKGRSNEGAALTTALVISSLGLFVQGTDKSVDAGTQYILYVDRDIPMGTPAAAPAAKDALEPRSPSVLAAPTSLTAAHTLPALAPADPPQLTVAEQLAVLPVRVRLVLTGDNSMTGLVIAFDGSNYTVKRTRDTLMVPAVSIVSVEKLAE